MEPGPSAGVYRVMRLRVLRIHRAPASGLLALALLAVPGRTLRRTPAPAAWRFDVTTHPDRLVPPVEVQPVRHRYRIPIEGLRFGQPGCRLATAGFALQPAHGALQLRFAESLFANGAEPVDKVEQFRQEALRQEDNGCLPAGGAPQVIQALVESLPLSSRGAFGLRYGAYELNGAMTLEPGLRLKVVAPLLKAGYTEIKTSAAPDAGPGQLVMNVEGLEGFETSYYEVRPRSGGGVEFGLTSVEQNRIGKISNPAVPAAFRFEIAPGIRHFRLLFLRRISVADRDISLLGGASWSVLLASAQRFDTVPGAVSECTTTPGLQCVAVTAKTAILSEVGVSLNGQPAFVPVGGNLGELLNNAGFETQIQHDGALANLKVERLWRGKLYPVQIDPKDSQTFRLVLFPGDRVSW